MEEKEIFEDEIEYSNAFKPKEVHLKENYVFYRRNILYRIWNKIVVFGVAFVFGFPKILQYGFKTTGRKNLRKVKGAIVISNHVWYTDVNMTQHQTSGVLSGLIPVGTIIVASTVEPGTTIGITKLSGYRGYEWYVVTG